MTDRAQRLLRLAATMNAAASLCDGIAADLRELAGPRSAEDHALRADTLRAQARTLDEQVNKVPAGIIPPFGDPWRRREERS